jgi:hypothetical protein
VLVDFELGAVLVIYVVEGEGVHCVHVGGFVVFFPLGWVDCISVVILVNGDGFVLLSDLNLGDERFK